MNSIIESLNLWGERFAQFAWPMLWQSSVLIFVLFAVDLALRRKVRPAVRYVLWLVVLVKLLLPPTLALPTSAAWWLRPSHNPQPPVRQFVVDYPNVERPQPSLNVYEAFMSAKLPSPRANLSSRGWFLVGSGFVSLGLLTWMLRRWWQVARLVRRASPATEALAGLVNDTRQTLGLRRSASLRFTDEPMSPAVCGLFRPVIILPHSLAEHLPSNQLRAVLLHELAHLKRGDVWVNCAQALLQVVYWWHPLLWLANARIRRLREEAVDDAVMLAMSDDAPMYAPTLLEVAKLAFHRPPTALGLVGIMESHSALRQRIERLVNSDTPRKSGLTILSAIGVLTFSALAVPMEKAPPRLEKRLLAQTTISAPEASRAPGESTATNDPATARPPSAFADKVPVLGDVPGLGKLFRSESKANRVATNDVSRLAELTNTMTDAASAQLTGPRTLAESNSPLGTATNSEPLYVRRYKVEPSTFLQALESITPIPVGQTNANAVARKLFAILGVELNPPKSVFFNDRSGELLVRATKPDLETIETILQVVNQAAQQVSIKAMMVELSPREARALQAEFWPDTGTNQFGILTEARFSAVRKALQQHAGVEILSMPEVVTASGRQAQLQNVEIRTLISGVNLALTNGATNSALQSDSVPFGSTLDVIPYVGADGVSIQLTLIPTISEFLGYDDPKDFTDKLPPGERPKEKLPLPRTRVRQITTSAVVSDGQTIVLVNFPDVIATRHQDGRETAKANPDKKTKQLIVFITPTLIDPAGNRVHLAR